MSDALKEENERLRTENNELREINKKLEPLTHKQGVNEVIMKRVKRIDYLLGTIVIDGFSLQNQLRISQAKSEANYLMTNYGILSDG